MVSAYEAGAGIKLPAAFRDYLLTRGQASLDDMLHPMHIPGKDARGTANPKAMETILDESGVDIQRLREPFPGGRFVHTCLDTRTDTLYLYGEEAGGRPAYLRVMKPREEN